MATNNNIIWDLGKCLLLREHSHSVLGNLLFYHCNSLVHDPARHITSSCIDTFTALACFTSPIQPRIQHSLPNNYNPSSIHLCTVKSLQFGTEYHFVLQNISYVKVSIHSLHMVCMLLILIISLHGTLS